MVDAEISPSPDDVIVWKEFSVNDKDAVVHIVELPKSRSREFVDRLG